MGGGKLIIMGTYTHSGANLLWEAPNQGGRVKFLWSQLLWEAVGLPQCGGLTLTVRRMLVNLLCLVDIVQTH